MRIQIYGDETKPKLLALHPMPADGASMVRLAGLCGRITVSLRRVCRDREKIPATLKARERKAGKGEQDQN